MNRHPHKKECRLLSKATGIPFYPIRFDFSTATVILPLLFLSFQLGLLSFLGFFQTFHETRLLHRLFLVFFQLGQQLIFVNRITENYSLQNRDQCGDEVIVGQTGCILIEEYQHHQRYFGSSCSFSLRQIFSERYSRGSCQKKSISAPLTV